MKTSNHYLNGLPIAYGDSGDHVKVRAILQNFSHDNFGPLTATSFWAGKKAEDIMDTKIINGYQLIFYKPSGFNLDSRLNLSKASRPDVSYMKVQLQHELI